MSPAARKVIRESEWMRVFKVENKKTYIYESKFLIDDLRVPVLAIEKKWPVIPLSEKVEFSLAFSSQPPRDEEDHAILQFLMSAGPEESLEKHRHHLAVSSSSARCADLPDRQSPTKQRFTSKLLSSNRITARN